MKIGEIAQEVQVSTSIIRHYEGRGVIPRARRDSKGYRDYASADLERIRLVVGARALGISLADIKEILAIYDRARTPHPRIIRLLQDKVLDVERRSSRLAAVRLELCRLRDLALALESCPADLASSQ